jgi:hypothetical protein
MRWKDATTYSQGARGVAEPRVWALDIGDGIRVVVHRRHGLPGWFVTCYALQINNHALTGDMDAEIAQSEGLDFVHTRALAVFRAIEAATESVR